MTMFSKSLHPQLSGHDRRTGQQAGAPKVLVTVSP
jgi:hypothetical protein